ncbi:MAG: DEAD/DEAH box helicase family protein [Anaerolineales bacterium]|nr:DEAD/DEAH box helicase family protein [Anaerolineales bacterium]
MLTFRHPFRKYQRMILAQVDSALQNPKDDRKYHIVAPPGAGKTIVGIELAARFGHPAVIFAPTTTIQGQWREKVGMFLDDPSKINDHASLDPSRLAPLNIYTYQLISTAAESQDHIRDMALQKWADDLVKEGQVKTTPDALARIETIRQNNPKAYSRERNNRTLRVKNDLLRREDVDIARFLHPNANALIQSLLDYGVRTVILDECHHLLDYWAIVLRHLIRQIPNPIVVGLTATLPDPDTDLQYENYTALLGDVDFEVPTPAVVKEGDLAPYRDLVYFTEPTREETNYLKHIQDAFEQATAALTTSTQFQRWLIQSLFEKKNPDGTPLPWAEVLNQNPLLALAGLRYLTRAGIPLPKNLPIPLEATDPLELPDWVTLLERYGLDYLQVSPDPADHTLLKHLKDILLPFGLTLTERGMRQSRSPGDLVLTFSESKDHAVAHILTEEAKAMGDTLRAVVVTDFERMSSGVQKLAKTPDSSPKTRQVLQGSDDVFPLDPDAGSAIRLFRHLVENPGTDPLEPMLVTGRTLLVDADHGDALIDRFNAWLQTRHLTATCRYKPTDSPQIYEVTGEGKDWSSRTYVRMVTEAFDLGITRCLVGTRGIFGEGWDSLSLNTLIDLTSVTTSTSVQQLRGRTIRLDPSWKRKVAHNWDVVCVAKKFERGDVDLGRFVQRHERYWGIVPMTPAEQRFQDAKFQVGKLAGLTPPQPSNLQPGLGNELAGQIVKGINHVSPEMAFELYTRGMKHTNFDKYTRRMVTQIPRRDEAYNLWKIGEDYSNFVYKATRLDTKDLKIRTVFTIQNTLKRMLREFLATLISSIMLVCSVVFRLFMGGLSEGGSDGMMLCVIAALFFGTIFVFVLNARSAYLLARKFLVEQPADAILLDVGRALLAALKDAGLVSRHLQPDYVRVAETPDNSYQVFLDYASPEDASVFIESYEQIFEPVVDQRYLILRDDTRLPNIGLAPMWFVLRTWFRDTAGYEPAYHPVPKLLASNKERAEAFAHYWYREVGGGELIFTRTEEGRRMLLHARAQRRPKAKGLAFEIWR